MTTQYATASYQEIIDLHTESDKVSVVGIHTPNSDTPYHMLKGFWNQFRKFKYNGCSLSLVPAAQLPPDPLNVSYEAGEPTIDPRDMLNPILFHGCHGDDLGAILNTLYSENLGGTGSMVNTIKADSVELNELAGASGNIPVTDLFESLYYRALTDRTWLKAHPQRGFRRSGLHPMVYSLASNHQYAIMPKHRNDFDLMPFATTHDDDGAASRATAGMIGNNPGLSGVFSVNGLGSPKLVNEGGSGFDYQMPAQWSNAIFTPRLQKLGWLDTRNVLGSPAIVSDISPSAPPSTKILANAYIDASQNTSPALCPKIYMGMILLPPAYKCEQYFRLVLNHSFSFAKFRGASMQYDTVGEVSKAYSVFNFNDVDSSKKRSEEEDEDVEPDPKAE